MKSYFFNNQFTFRQKARIFRYRIMEHIKYLGRRWRYGTDTWFLRPSALWKHFKWRLKKYFSPKPELVKKLIQSEVTLSPLQASPLQEEIKAFGERMYQLQVHYFDEKDGYNREQRKKMIEELEKEITDFKKHNWHKLIEINWDKK